MKYEYKWVHPHNIKKFKKKLIPLKSNKFIFGDYTPIIRKGKYKDHMGIEGLVLCLYKK
jgi:hypothetical protein